MANEKKRAFDGIGRSGVGFFRGALRRKKKIASGKTYNSITFRVSITAFAFSIEFYADKAWLFILRGRKPGGKFPPKHAILDWMKAKKIKPKKINGKTITEDSLAFLIRRKIARDGIEKTNLYEGADSFFRGQIDSKAKDAVGRDLKETVFQEMGKFADATA